MPKPPAWGGASFASPYHDDGHRALAGALDVFIRQELQEVVSASDRNVGQRIKACVATLARAGWLNHLDVDARGDHATPEVRRLDLRRIGLIRQGLAYADDVADVAFSIQGLGLAPIALYGDPMLRKAFLEPSLRGELLGGFALTEPTGGSAPSHMSLTARMDGDHFVLNGEKTWISQAGVADYYCLFAATNPDMGVLGVSCIVVPAGTPGLTVVPSSEFLAERPVGSLQFYDCRVPVANLVGKAGFGFRYAMQVIEMYRITLAYATVGSSLRALDMAVEQARQRRVADQRLRDFQLVQDKIAEMSVRCSAASLLSAHAAWIHDVQSRGLSKFASTAKYFATESAQVVIDQALQLFGAGGLVKGHRLEALYRQIRSSRIYEGTSEIQKLIIAEAELQG